MSRRPTVALATSAAYASLPADDRLLLAPLAARGVDAAPAVWNDPAIDWRAFDAVVLRSTWDYHHAVDAFLAWIDGLERAGVPLFNPPHVVRWNADKRYLLDLVARDVAIVPTAVVQPGAPRALRVLAADHGWEQVVVKPAVSASAHGTWRSAGPISEDDEARFRAQDAPHGLLVQRYVDAIECAGEWSLQYFDARFSHAARKWPGRGDYRVQGEHGGRSMAAAPPAGVLAAAAAVFAALPFPAADCAYTRVDGVIDDDDTFLLMEIELIEPSLFLAMDEAAAGRLADAIAARLRGR